MLISLCMTVFCVTVFNILNCWLDFVAVDDGEFAQFCGPNASSLVIQEKVDGANLGLSIDSDWKIRAQNRSHFVNSETHAQFGNLDAWLDSHRHELCAILEPGRHILFGEWCRAKHRY